MRDAFQRAGIRQESKSARPGRPGGKPQGPRTSRAVNLKRLASELDYDLLAAALGVSETTLRNLTNDRAQAQDEQGVVHIVHKLEQAGMPHTWLDQPNARLVPDQLTNLRRMASSSDSKAAIRRANLRKVVDAFQDKLELLADALELAVPSITAILDGQLVFDDQRFGHINPRLVAGGFPDGWLEHSDAKLTSEMIQGLETLATDVLERELAELEESRTQAHVNPEPAAAATVDEEPLVADVPAEPQVSVVSENAVTPTVSPAPALPPFAKRAAAATTAPAAPTAQPTRAAPPALPSAQQHELPLAPINQPIEEPVMAKTPPAAKKGMPSTTAKPGSKAPPPPALSASALAGLQHRSHAAKSKLRDKVGIGPKNAQPKPHAVKRTAPAKTGAFVRGKDVLTKEQSLARAEALNKLLDNSRRGAKVTLWRDLLGSSLPFWGNVRHGTATFQDVLATRAEQALGLPENWLDNPSFPPASLAAWVTDPTVPLPKPAAADGAPPATGKATRGAAASGTAQQTAQDTAHKSTASLKGAPMPRLPRAGTAGTQPAAEPGVTAPTATPATQASAAPAATPPRLKRTSQASRQQAATAQEPDNTPVAPATTPEVAGPAPAPAPGAGFTWRPVANPKSVATPGPLTQALSGVLTELALEGRFTDDDALRLINFLKSAG